MFFEVILDKVILDKAILIQAIEVEAILVEAVLVEALLKPSSLRPQGRKCRIRPPMFYKYILDKATRPKMSYEATNALLGHPG